MDKGKEEGRKGRTPTKFVNRPTPMHVAQYDTDLLLSSDNKIISTG